MKPVLDFHGGFSDSSNLLGVGENVRIAGPSLAPVICVTRHGRPCRPIVGRGPGFFNDPGDGRPFLLGLKVKARHKMGAPRSSEALEGR